MANALLSTVNAAKQRQPMCAECEKSLPNQIVFDKIESIIRLMQDEQNGLPVKTAKSFMSKIPSVFTGTDLISWMMRNLKLEDQQEAVHLANLIASHGYIFPIEDHTLSIKNDCTFYRFQTPCLWPSNNSDPENTDYAVYLCKRTMQGKTRLELADYEAENLARLQKMFSRKWEFIFMQAESQAKVDKKRDKLERKVLDSQERAFWDVYRPVPGCVNTTELDIKKACRLSKSSKRCGECQKVAAALSGSNTTSNLAPSPEVTFAQDTKPGDSSSSSISKTVQIIEETQQAVDREKLAVVAPQVAADSGVQSSSEDVNRSPDSKATDIVEDISSTVSSSDNQTNVKQLNKEETTKRQHQQTTTSADKPVKAADDQAKSAATSTTAATSKLGVGGNHHHQNYQHHHHHLHHHHHHHHPHQHGHHHHHHHRQCPHHKQHQAAAAAAAASTSTTQAQAQAQTHLALKQQRHNQPLLRQHQHMSPVCEQQLSIPTESILTTTVAASTLGWTADQLSGLGGEQKSESSRHQLDSVSAATDDDRETITTATKTTTSESVRTNEPVGKVTKLEGRSGDGQERLVCSKKGSVGSVDRFMRAPSVQGVSNRRKSECNRMFSMTESHSTTDETTTGGGGDTSRHLAADSSSAGGERRAHHTTVAGDLAGAGRPASACCSFSSLDKDNNNNLSGGHRTNQRSASNQSNQQQQMLRKSSLNILRSSTGDTSRPSGSLLTGSSIGGGSVGGGASSAGGPLRKSSTHLQGGHSTLKGTQSVCTTTGTSSSVSELASGDRQNIGDLERELEALKVRLDRRIGGVKMSKVTQSYLSYFKQWAEYDPFIAQPIPSNPWISDSTELWDSERQTKDVHCRRVRRWAFSLKELLSDPAGREQFHRFLEKEFSAENLKFWDAVQELKRVHSRDVACRVEAIWTEYLAQDANCPINIDSKSYETSKKNMDKNKNNRYIFDEAAGHVYQLMKNDSYPRYLRSDMYKDYKETSEKKRTNQVAFDVFKPQITTLKHKFNF